MHLGVESADRLRWSLSLLFKRWVMDHPLLEVDNVLFVYIYMPVDLIRQFKTKYGVDCLCSSLTLKENTTGIFIISEDFNTLVHSGHYSGQLPKSNFLFNALVSLVELHISL